MNLNSGEPTDIREVLAKAQLAAPPPYNAKWGAKYKAAMAPGKLAHYVESAKNCQVGFPAQMEDFGLMQLFVEPGETLMLFESIE